MKPSSNKTVADPARRKLLNRAALITLAAVLISDQASKYWVKTNMYLDESITVFGNWFFIHFIENPGMAFGLELGGDWGKLLLSLFRLVAIVAISWYLRGQIRSGAHKGLVVCISLVLAGAIGNMIDSAFYGLIFSESPRFTPQVATLFPDEGGYAAFLKGKVVDMLYFPIIDTTWPEWMPWVGGERFQFFRPVFNIADSSISVGMAILLIWQRKFFPEASKRKSSDDSKVGESQQSGIGEKA